MLIAVEGCAHGELDNIYASLAVVEERHGCKVDVLLICGDFQAVRNAADLAGMACPPKYRAMQSFYKYYTGEKVAPVLTIFIGGNHEASAHLCELCYGGWAAPNIFYLGSAGVVNVGGVRIGGLSGIYKSNHYHQGHHERPPFSEDEMRSCYHIRETDVFRLRQLRKPMDVFLSHDWPQHIAKHGDTHGLVRRKPFLQSEIADGSLGSPPAAQILHTLRPSYWFSAHLHVKFAATVMHAAKATAEATAATDAAAAAPAVAVTKFLSLGKCTSHGDFLQIVEVDGDGSASPPALSYDAEWLAVLRSTAHLETAARGRVDLGAAAIAAASAGRCDFTPTAEEEAEVVARGEESLHVPLDFAITAPAYVPGQNIVDAQAAFTEHPQTTRFVDTFGLPADFRTRRGATHQGGGGGGGDGGGGSGGGGSGSAGYGMAMPPPPSRPSMQLPEPVSSSFPPQPFRADPAGYGYDPNKAAKTSAPAHTMGLLNAVHVPPLDEEIDLDDD